MRLSLLLFGLAMTMLCVSARSGVNYGGVILLHANETLEYSLGNDYCGMSDVTECETVDVRVDSDGAESFVVYAIAAFDPVTRPVLSGLTFGIAYDETRILIEDWSECGDFELHTGGGSYPEWPSSGSGIAITWAEAERDPLVECCWLEAYTYDGSPALLSIDRHPVGGNSFADDGVPAALDDPMALGALGFNTDGSVPCEGLWGSTLELSPIVLTVYEPCGGTFPLRFGIHEIEDLSDIEVCLGFDDDLLVFDRIEIDPTFLESTGRDAYLADTGNCNPYGWTTRGRDFRIATSGSGPGASGSGALADIYFAPVAGTSSESRVSHEVQRIRNTRYEDIYSAAGPDLQVTHSPYCFGDFTADGDVTVFDLARNLPRWGCSEGDSCYDPVYDVNLIEEGNYCASTPDGRIDVVDIQRVAGRWHLGCDGDSGTNRPGHGEATGEALPTSLGSAPSVRISPEFQMLVADVGDTVSVRLVVDEAVLLGAFEASVGYSSSSLEMLDVEGGAFLSSSGRTVYAFDTKSDSSAGLVQFGACSVGETPGPDGSGVLAEIFFQVRECDTSFAVTIEDVVLTSVAGAPQELGGSSGGTLEIVCASSSIPGQALSSSTRLFIRGPNPSAGSTEIVFDIDGSGGDTVPVRLAIFDATGRLMRVLLDRDLLPGRGRRLWDGRDGNGLPVASGAYFCLLQAGENRDRERLIVVR